MDDGRRPKENGDRMRRHFSQSSEGRILQSHKEGSLESRLKSICLQEPEGYHMDRFRRDSSTSREGV